MLWLGSLLGLYLLSCADAIAWTISHWLAFADLNAMLEGPADRAMLMSGYVPAILTWVAVAILTPMLLGCHGNDKWQSVVCVVYGYVPVAIAASALAYEAHLVINDRGGDVYCGPNQGHCGGAFVCSIYRNLQVSDYLLCEKWFCYVQSNQDHWDVLQRRLWDSAIDQGFGFLSMVAVIMSALVFCMADPCCCEERE